MSIISRMIQVAIKIKKNLRDCYAWSTSMRERSCCRNCRSLTTAARTRKSGSSCCYLSATKLPHFGPCKSTFKRRVTSLLMQPPLLRDAEIYTRASLLVYIMRNYPENDRNGRLLFKFRSQADPVPVAVRCGGRAKNSHRWTAAKATAV